MYLKLTILARLALRIHLPLPSSARVIGTYRHVVMYGFYVGPGNLNSGPLADTESVFIHRAILPVCCLHFWFCTDLQADCPDHLSPWLYSVFI